jgi:cysteinyl-tRNA synthetase
MGLTTKPSYSELHELISNVGVAIQLLRCTHYLDLGVIDLGEELDGFYLDRVDVHWERRGDRASSEEDMINFVRDLSAYAKALNPEFLIVPQNAEGLLEVKKYLEVIDRIATESLFFLSGKSGERPPAGEFEYSYNVLKTAVSAGIFVLTVDYVSES